ncbi:MAG: hypothetical protein M3O30_03025 [Planctomycetota bacterium]|nr:hypothetical protein [Planctomycetota bacterium]
MLKTSIAIMALAALFIVGCNDHPPMYGRAENYPREHLQFGDSDLQSFTRVDPVTAARDPAGLLHITVNIRSTIDRQQYVDAYVTFLRGGQMLEKLGPKTVTLKGNLPDIITFNSTQPADDYFVTLDYAK